MKKTEAKVEYGREELITAILDFYVKHPGYRMTQSEFIGIISAITQQMMSDI